MINSTTQAQPQLTERGLHQILEESEKGIVLQVLSADLLPNNKPGANNLKFKVTISDGLAKHKAVLGNKAAELFATAGTPELSVIRVNDVLVKPATPKKNQPDIIGRPVEYKEWHDQYNEYKIYAEIHEKKTQLSIQNTPEPSQTSRAPHNIRRSISDIAEDLPRESSMFNYEEKRETTPKSVRTDPRFEPIDKARSFENATRQTFGIASPSPIFEETTHKKVDSNDRPESPKSTERSESDTLAGRVARQMSAFPFFGMGLRCVEPSDMAEVQHAAKSDLAFAADLFDRNGNKVTAVIFGENAEIFFDQLNMNATNIFTNISNEMAVEK